MAFLSSTGAVHVSLTSEASIAIETGGGARGVEAALIDTMGDKGPSPSKLLALI